VSLEKSQVPSRELALKDDFDFPAKPCQWTPSDRKYALMQRDPLVKNYDNIFKKWLKARNDPDLNAKAENLADQIRKKWAVKIYIPETTIQGLTDVWFPTTLAVYVSVEDARKISWILLRGKDGTRPKITSASFERNHLIYCPPHKIPIIIDPTLLTLNDARVVKTAVWDIVKAEIEKQRSIVKGRALTIPPREPKALAEVLHCRPDSFVKYLRWYDLKKAGLPFRLIALIEFFNKPDAKEVKFQQYSSLKKKPKIGMPVKGESTVREGYNLINRAIFRNSALSEQEQVSILEEYKCPNHGQNCPLNCDYFKQWVTIFEREEKPRPQQDQIYKF
jgi:hypothetical protein